MSRRFDYVKYDEKSVEKQDGIKSLFKRLENAVDSNLKNGRAKYIVMTHLEEANMWTGKAIRDEQIERDNTPDCAERSDQ